MPPQYRDKQKIIELKKWLGTGSINIFGMPFAGKDTHSKELAKIFDGVVIGGGEIIRSFKEHAHVLKQIESGALAPQDEFLKIVLPYFSKSEFEGIPLILSSVGRWHGEQSGVLKAAKNSGHPIKAVIYLNVSVKEVKRRWAISQEVADRGSRKDDMEHILDVRLNEFQTKTLPVVDFYKSHNLLIEINGEESKEQVLTNILARLSEMSNTVKL
jgi:adenylate kinase